MAHPSFPKRKPKRWSDAKTLKMSNYNHFQNIPSRKGHPNPSNTPSQTPQNHHSGAQNRDFGPDLDRFFDFLETCSNMFPGHFRTILGQKRHHIRHLKTGFWYPKTLISTLPKPVKKPSFNSKKVIGATLFLRLQNLSSVHFGN